LISGGGGLGDPLERDPNLVLMDLLNGYILEEQVKSVYME
jgi:N-methylhydantoinase B